MLRDRILPGPIVKQPKLPVELRGILHGIRSKVNSAILRFEDEDELEEVEIDLTPNEGWILDQALAFDGKKGAQTNLAVQIMRGLWSSELGLPSRVVKDPWQEWNKEEYTNMLSEEGKEEYYA